MCDERKICTVPILLHQFYGHFTGRNNLNLLLDEMGERIDDLEKHVTGLMAQAGIEHTSEELMVRFLFRK